MATTKVPGGGARQRDAADALIRSLGHTPRWWSNAPGDTYGSHEHTYAKVLLCVEGSIIFHTRDGDVLLEAGDRLDIEPRTEHAATVGDIGVTCVEGGG